MTMQTICIFFLTKNCEIHTSKLFWKKKNVKLVWWWSLFNTQSIISTTQHRISIFIVFLTLLMIPCFAVPGYYKAAGHMSSAFDSHNHRRTVNNLKIEWIYYLVNVLIF